MSKVPSLNYDKVIKALQRDGWIIVRQQDSHIRLQKHIENETLKIYDFANTRRISRTL